MKKKLIEVALPLEAINRLSAEEKSVPRRGHPQTIHLWWARRPLAACRAVLFASLVDDPSGHPDLFPTEDAQDRERQRLFRLIEELVTWENSSNERILERARAEILRSTSGNPPKVLDPFCGGGSIPLEAQRLGLEAFGSDLNPVAVLITKALIEIPPSFEGRPPVNPDAARKISAPRSWTAALGLAVDLRYYGNLIRDRAEERIGFLYPKMSPVDGAGATTPLAWLWARTIECPNPACGARIPIVRSFMLSTNDCKRTWVEPQLDHLAKNVDFIIRQGNGTPPEGTRQRGRTTCIFCGNTINDANLRAQACSKGLGRMLMAIVAQGQRGRVYLSPRNTVIEDPEGVDSKWLEQRLPDNPRWFSPPGYGLLTFQDLFTPRQLVSLTTFASLVEEVRVEILTDARKRGFPNDERPLSEGGHGPVAYADALAVYLSLAISRLATYNNTICHWNVKGGSIQSIFSRQAIPMSWDFMEICPFVDFSGNWSGAIQWIAETLENLVPGTPGTARQLDATASFEAHNVMVSTDPPYYDNIGYADLSDFFYLWLRRSLANTFPTLFCERYVKPIL